MAKKRELLQHELRMNFSRYQPRAGEYVFFEGDGIVSEHHYPTPDLNRSTRMVALFDHLPELWQLIAEGDRYEALALLWDIFPEQFPSPSATLSLTNGAK
jgi:hypothetical protein